MKPITIPAQTFRGSDLVVIPREEYEEFLSLKRVMSFQASPKMKQALKRARANKKSNNYLSLYEFRKTVESRG